MSKSALKAYSSFNNRLFCIKRSCRYGSNDTSCSKSSDGSNSGKSGERSGGSMYDARKYSHSLPCDDVEPPFDIPKMPSGVFRCTSGEVIGPQAGKCAYYRNPEYYSFHHMSFFDMHMIMLPYRKLQIKTGRKPKII